MDNIVHGVDRKCTSNTATFTEFANTAQVTVRSIVPLQLYYSGTEEGILGDQANVNDGVVART